MNINATLLGQMITFVIFVLITMKYIWPLFKKVLDERAKKIADGLAAAERGQRDLEVAEAKTRELISEAKQQAAKVIEEATRRAHTIVDEARVQARQEGELLLANAKTELDQQVATARNQLRAEVAKLAIASAEKILQREVNATDANRWVNELIAKEKAL